MRSKGPRFTLGVWGLRVCSLDVAFVAATVHNRSQPLSRFEAHFEVKSAKKTDGLRPPLEVEMMKKCTPFWREAH